MRFLTLCYIAAISIIGLRCSDHDKFSLILDFNSRPLWHYELKSEVLGAYHHATGQRNFSNAMHVNVCVESAGDNKKINVWADSVDITSDFLSAAEVQNLQRQILATRIPFSISDNTLIDKDSIAVPLVKLGQWDLYRSFINTIPALPGKRVRLGETWERERQFPLESDHGKLQGNLYQLFTFDSISVSDGNRFACISWSFSYRLEPAQKDTIAALGEIPMSGNGWGNSRIDIRNKYLQNARVEIEVNRPEGEKPGLSWIEIVEMSIKEPEK